MQALHISCLSTCVIASKPQAPISVLVFMLLLGGDGVGLNKNTTIALTRHQGGRAHRHRLLTEANKQQAHKGTQGQGGRLLRSQVRGNVSRGRDVPVCHIQGRSSLTGESCRGREHIPTPGAIFCSERR